MTDDSIADLLVRAAAERPDAPLLSDGSGNVLTVAEVESLTAACVDWLAKAGVRSGMTVAWQLPSCLSAPILMLALARLSVIQAPVLHLYRKREIAVALDVAGADVLIVDESTNSEAPDGIAVLRIPDEFLDSLERGPQRARHTLEDHSSAHDGRWIFFTSGTTGRPKGVIHTDATLVTAARGYTTHIGLGDHPDEVITILFPVAHIGGVILLMSALLGGFQAVMVPKVDMRELPKMLKDNRVTVTGASTALFQMLLKEQVESASAERLFPTLRMLIGGGAACPPEVHAKVREHLGVPILYAYGSTEAPLVCASEATDSVEQLHHSCGRPIPGAQIRISASGEVELCGASVTPGYLDAAEWARTLTPDGWLRTGDRGRLRSDGRLVITGRTKDVIIRKGENISPEEVENELLAHPLIDAATVLGVPDEERGEMVCAVVQRSNLHPDVTLDEILAFLNQRGLMKQKWPERLVIVDEFPRIGLGKVSKKALAEQIFRLDASSSITYGN